MTKKKINKNRKIFRINKKKNLEVGKFQIPADSHLQYR